MKTGSQLELLHTDPPRELVQEFVANGELADRLRSLQLECGTRVLSMDVSPTGYTLHISRPGGAMPQRIGQGADSNTHSDAPQPILEQ